MNKTREFENKEQTARKELEGFRQGAIRPKEAREFRKRLETALKELENFRTRSRSLERD